MTWQSFNALLPLWSDPDVLESLQTNASTGAVSALLLAGDGSSEANPPDWIAALHPQIVLQGGGLAPAEGLPGYPAGCAAQGCSFLTTQANGWIDLSTDGEQLWVEVEKR